MGVSRLIPVLQSKNIFTLFKKFYRVSLSLMHPNTGPIPNANCGICDFFGERAVSWSHVGVCCDAVSYTHLTLPTKVNV